MSAFNFISVINSPSKYNPNNPITKYSLIDQIWVNFTHLNISSGVICDDISDHFPIFMHFKFTGKNSHKITRYRIFNDNNINKFKENFNSLDFTECFTSNSADVAYNIFHKLLYKSYYNSFPLKTKRIKSDNFSEWITPELKFCLKKKYRLLNMLKSSQITKSSYTEYKNLLNNAIRQAKIIFYMKKAIASNIDAKSTWKFINQVLNKNKKDVVHSVNNNSGISLSGINMSNYFNDFFVDTIPNMIKNRPILNVVTQNPFNLVKNNRDSFFLYPMTTHEVQNNIKKLKNKSCSFNDIQI